MYLETATYLSGPDPSSMSLHYSKQLVTHGPEIDSKQQQNGHYAEHEMCGRWVSDFLHE